jgi:CDP-diacylglycerol--glycerol-3-phosphate 3-phosphatidyltransferase
VKKITLVYLVTVSRVFFAAIVAVLSVFHEEPYNWTVWVSLALIGLCELTDLFDGLLARRWNVVSDFGKMLDPYADSVTRIIIYWTLAYLGRAWAVVFLVMAARDIIVGFIRLVLTRKGRDVSARFTGKAKAVVLGVGSIILMGGPLYWDIWNAGLKPYIVGACSIAAIFMICVAMIHHLAAARPVLFD